MHLPSFIQLYFACKLLFKKFRQQSFCNYVGTKERAHVYFIRPEVILHFFENYSFQILSDGV